MNIRIPGRCLAAAALAAALTSCAVARIDVDVYKGPLANHEQVQIQQLAAMAIGAKPLLTQLRNRLEWPNDSVLYCVRAKGMVLSENEATPPCTPPNSRTPESIAYLDSYIPEFIPHVEQSGRVNAVLHLYEDQAAPRLISAYARDATILTKEYKSSLAKLHPNPKEDVELWNAISTQSPATPGEAPPTLGAVQEEGNNENDRCASILAYTISDNTKRLALLSLYRRLLHPESLGLKYRGVDCIQEVGDKQVGRFLASAGGKDAKPDSYDNSVNKKFEELADRATVAKHSIMLFGPSESGTAKHFQARVVDVSRAFLHTRLSLRQMWELSVRTLRDIQYDKEALAWPGIHAFNNDLSASIVSLTQPRELAVAIQLSTANSDPTSKLDPMVYLRDREPWRSVGEKPEWNETEYKIANSQLLTQLSDSPSDMSIAMVAADRSFVRWQVDGTSQSITDPIKNDKYRKRRQSAASRAYGVVRGPETLDSAESASGIAYAQEIIITDDIRNTTANTSALGFDRGRNSSGLESLIANFSGSEGADCSKGAGCELRNELLNALVQFSEKVLVIANNEALLNGGTPNPIVENYTLVLQSIGNSILVQADEIRHRDDHAKRLSDRAVGERQAATAASSRSAAQMASDLLIGLNAKRAAASGAQRSAADAAESAQKALDDAIAALPKQVPSEDAVHDAEDALATAVGDAKDVTHALRTLDGLKHDEAPELVSGEDEKVLSRDAADVKQAAVASAASQTGDQMRLALMGQISQKSTQIRPGRDPARAERLLKAKTYLDSPAAAAQVAGIASTAAAEAFAKVLATVAADRTAALRDVSDARKARDDAKSKLATEQAEYKQLAALKRAAQDDLDKAKSKLAAADEDHAAAADAADTIAALREEFLREAQRLGIARDARAAFALLAQIVADRLAKAGDEKAKAKFTHTVKMLGEASPPSDASATTGLPLEGGSQKDAMDDMIALLRYELLEAQKTDGNRANKIREALETAYEQRGGMAYLRPAGGLPEEQPGRQRASGRSPGRLGEHAGGPCGPLDPNARRRAGQLGSDVRTAQGRRGNRQAVLAEHQQRAGGGRRLHHLRHGAGRHRQLVRQGLFGRSEIDHPVGATPRAFQRRWTGERKPAAPIGPPAQGGIGRQSRRDSRTRGAQRAQRRRRRPKPAQDL